MKFVFDIETNGMLNKVSKIHSIVLYNLRNDKVISCADDAHFTPLEEGIALLQDAELLVGHNIIKYDIPVLEKLVGFKTNANILDTLTLSSLIYPNLIDMDMRNKGLPSRFTGKHSLEAWGERLFFSKGDFGKTSGWEDWSLAMQKYCERDVALNKVLYDLLVSKKYSQTSIDIEMEFQKIIHQQEQNGVAFNRLDANVMYYKLKKDQNAFRKEVKEIIPDRRIETIFVPKRNNKTLGYKKGIPFTKVRTEAFNPGSRLQIGKYFIEKYQWCPLEFTKTSKLPKCSSEIIEALPYAEAPIIAKYLSCSKLLGQLGDGDKAWLKLEKDGRIYGSVRTNGAITGRATHNQPNLAQIPRVGSYMGKECRALFTASKGMVMVGADAKGLELRCLAHYLHAYDSGHYTNLVLQGDIHIENQRLINLPSKNVAKRFIYAFNYGGGDALLGSIIDPAASTENQKVLGATARYTFYRQMPAIEKLVTSVKETAKRRHYLIGIDGRHLPIREEYRALNTLLQGCGAVVMKKANIIFWESLKEKEIIGVYQLLNIHDEIQVECKEEIAKEVGELLVKAIVKAGEFFKLNCPLDGEYKIGNNWAETH